MQMELREALGLGEGEVVALVGAGGKTSAMFRLARELAQAGERVVTTTTTKIYTPTPQETDRTLLVQDLEEALTGLAESLREKQIITVACGLVSEGKLGGVPPEWVASFRAVAPGTTVIVEADGAARKSFKAPREGEPVFPGCTTLVVPLVGMDCLGKPLGETWVHRPEVVSRLTGAVPGDPITPEMVATVLLHPRGTMQGRPFAARVIPLLNKVDDAKTEALALPLAELLLAQGVAAVVLASLRSQPPIRRVMTGKPAEALV